MFTNMNMLGNVYIYIYIDIHTYIHAYALCVYIYMNIYIYMHIHIFQNIFMISCDVATNCADVTRKDCGLFELVAR